MKTIALAIDDAVLDRARLVAAQRRTTLNAMVREFLAEVGKDKVAEARRQLLHLMDMSEGRMAPGWTFDRDETHERRVDPGGRRVRERGAKAKEDAAGPDMSQMQKCGGLRCNNPFVEN
jgi:hypothetical protein